MLTKISIKNFKSFGTAEIELGNPVVFIGPNNSGKTSALQSLALWNAGLKKWNEKRKGDKTPEKRPGISINYRDLVSIPIPNARFLWKGLHVREGSSNNIRMEIIVEGLKAGKHWSCGLEFDYRDEEILFCRPLRIDADGNERMPVPDEAGEFKIAFLPPMSGLASNEDRLEIGSINVRIGEGRTAEVLRNLCYTVYNQNPDKWNTLVLQIKSLFGVEITEPEYLIERGEIIMGYTENNIRLDLSCSGRGLQQTLLLLSYMYANPDSVLILDEPDAHLEIIRQRQVYRLLSEVASENNNQIIAASHSEVLLNEAANRDVVIAFVGTPHRINDRPSQVLKALRDIGFEDYYLAEQNGWILYLEGPTDLAILHAFAKKLNNKKALEILERPFIKYLGNQPTKVSDHFYGLREAKSDLIGIALFDRLEQAFPAHGSEIRMLSWNKREIENYLCTVETLVAYAKNEAKEISAGPLFEDSEAQRRESAMLNAIQEIEKSLSDIEDISPWDASAKVSDQFLVPLFKKYYKILKLPNMMAKKNLHVLADFVPEHQIDPEISDKLQEIVDIANNARPYQ